MVIKNKNTFLFISLLPWDCTGNTCGALPHSGPGYGYFCHVNILSVVILYLFSPVIWNHWIIWGPSRTLIWVSPLFERPLLKRVIVRTHQAMQGPRYARITLIPKKTEKQKTEWNDLHYAPSSPFSFLPWGRQASYALHLGRPVLSCLPSFSSAGQRLPQASPLEIQIQGF